MPTEGLGGAENIMFSVLGHFPEFRISNVLKVYLPVTMHGNLETGSSAWQRGSGGEGCQKA